MFTGSHECVYCHCSLPPRRGAAIRYLRFGGELWFLDMIFLDMIFLDMIFLDMIFLDMILLGMIFLGMIFLGMIFLGMIFLGMIILGMIFLDMIFLDMIFLDMISFATGSREQLDGENSEWSGEKENERSKRASCVVGKIVKSGMKWSE